MSKLNICEFRCDICGAVINSTVPFTFDDCYVCTTCLNKGVLWAIRKANEEQEVGKR